MGEGFRVRVTQALLDRLAGRRPHADREAGPRETPNRAGRRGRGRKAAPLSKRWT
mgnify:CR=1 FL=1